MSDRTNGVKDLDADSPNDVVQRFLARLQLSLDARGWSRSKLAEELKIGRSAVSEWWTKGRVPMGDVMLRLPELLQVEPGWLFGASDGGGAPRDEEDTTAPPTDDAALLAEVRGILRDQTIPPGMRVLMIDAANSAWLSAALYRGEVGAQIRARAVLQAEETGRVRAGVIEQAQKGATERRKEMQQDRSWRLSALSEEEEVAVEDFVRDLRRGRAPRPQGGGTQAPEGRPPRPESPPEDPTKPPTG